MPPPGKEASREYLERQVVLKSTGFLEINLFSVNHVKPLFRRTETNQFIVIDSGPRVYTALPNTELLHS